MINDPGKNLISCPVVQGWFPIKELTQDNYFLSTVPNLLFNRGHSSLSVWKQNQFLNLHLVNIPKDHWMLNLEGTLMAVSLSLFSSCSSDRTEGEGWHTILRTHGLVTREVQFYRTQLGFLAGLIMELPLMKQSILNWELITMAERFCNYRLRQNTTPKQASGKTFRYHNTITVSNYFRTP